MLRLALPLLYPPLVYLAVTRWNPRVAGVVVVVGAVAALLSILRDPRAPALLRAALPVLPALSLGAAAAFSNDEGFLLLEPVLLNLALFVAFTASLRPGRVSVIERIALGFRPDLDAQRLAHCRQVTVVWCGFFLFNVFATAWLGYRAPLGWWAAYCGGIAYLVMGALFALELWLRRRRFPSSPSGV